MSKPTTTQIQDLRVAIDTVVRTFKVVDGPGGINGSKLNPPDVQALLFISRHDHCIANDIAGFLGVVPTTASAVLDRLVRRGLVVRSRTEENRRIVQLSLSAEGQQAVEMILAEQSRHCAQMLERLNIGEREDFVKAMTKISNNIT